MTAVIISLDDYRTARAAACPSANAVPVDKAIEICLDHPDILTDWEAKFLVSIRRTRGELSTKQHTILQRIFDKCPLAEPDNAS